MMQFASNIGLEKRLNKAKLLLLRTGLCVRICKKLEFKQKFIRCPVSVTASSDA